MIAAEVPTTTDGAEAAHLHSAAAVRSEATTPIEGAAVPGLHGEAATVWVIGQAGVALAAAFDLTGLTTALAESPTSSSAYAASEGAAVTGYPALDASPPGDPVGEVFPVGRAVEAATGADILNRFVPHHLLAELSQAVEELVVRVEEETGQGWDAWAVAAGLAAVAAELGRRQLRRPKARAALARWGMGDRDGL